MPTASCRRRKRRGRAHPAGAPRAIASRSVAEAKGQADRFLKVYEQYKKAPDVTRKRMFLETMERVLGDTDKIILDEQGGTGRGALSCRSSDFTKKRRRRRPRAASNEQNRSHRRPHLLGARRGRRLSDAVHRQSDPAGDRARVRQAEARSSATRGCTRKIPFIQTVDISTSASSTSTLPRRRSSPPTRSASSSTPSRATASPIRCCSSKPCATSASRNSRLGAILEASLRRVLGGSSFRTWCGTSARS